MQKARSSSAKKKLAATSGTAVEPASVIMEVEEKKKRGRKKNVEIATTTSSSSSENVVIEVAVKKRVSRKKKESDAAVQDDTPIEPETPFENDASESSTPHSMSHKKRGRKPKGGKVIQQLMHETVSINDTPNIILHLKCSVSDIPGLNASLTETSLKPGDVISFNALESKGADLNDSYQSNVTSTGNFIISSSSALKPKTTSDALTATNSYNHLNDADYENDDDDNDNGGENNLKDIWKKLNHLKLCFHKSDVFQNIGAGTRRSCCFWDTCEFDTPPIYIPKCITQNGGYTVYGCFCSPECAVAYLMNEGIDTSVKFERCQMLNSMYGRALNYEKSIKPAPNPQYILNKFYGNLSIQEYRKLFKSEQIIYVVNKPLTHILPEMYEDNNDFLLNNKVIPNNNYKLKKKTSAFG
jgi:hypothetical protein